MDKKDTNNKIRVSPKALENRNILFHAFTNSTEYRRYIQITKLIINKAAQHVHLQSIPIHYFNEGSMEETQPQA